MLSAEWNLTGSQVLSANHILASVLGRTGQYVEQLSQSPSSILKMNLHVCIHYCRLRAVSAVQAKKSHHMRHIANTSKSYWFGA